MAIEMTAKVFSNQKAEELVKRLTELEDGGWAYVVVHDHRGPNQACIKIVDEFHETVGWL
jgi:hypothetical protein